MKLYTSPANTAAQKVLVAAQFASKSIEIVTKFSDNDVKGKAPVDRLPLLETSQGFLFESHAIARFVCAGNDELLGKDDFAKARIISWCDFCTHEIEVAAQCVCYPILGWADNVPEVTKQGKADLMAALKVLDTHLKSETFLTGRAISLADIVVAVSLVLPMKLALGDKDRKACANVTRWFTTVANQPEFIKVVGPVSFVKNAVKAPEPAKVEKPVEKKAEAEKPVEAPAKVSALTLLGKLPSTPFVLDSWKRQYSNAPNHNYYLSMPWFWENCDFGAYSLWRSDYKYNSELSEEPAFMVSNLAGGFIQRCDSVRKYMFGSLNILGSNNVANEMIGIWLMRGSGDECVKALLEENPDAEYHSWTQITEFDEATKTLIAEVWCDEEKNKGKEIIDGKVFK